MKTFLDLVEDVNLVVATLSGETEAIVDDLIESLTESVDLAEEDLQELKSETLKSYAKKGGESAKKISRIAYKNDDAARKHAMKGDDRKASDTKRVAEKQIDKSEKRAAKVSDAKKTLRKRGVSMHEGLLDTMLAQLDLSEEQLDELKKSTLQSYAKKAVKQYHNHSGAAGDHLDAADEKRDAGDKKGEAHHMKKYDHHNTRALKRIGGADKANAAIKSGRVTKEEVELDESKKVKTKDELVTAAKRKLTTAMAKKKGKQD